MSQHPDRSPAVNCPTFTPSSVSECPGCGHLCCPNPHMGCGSEADVVTSATCDDCADLCPAAIIDIDEAYVDAIQVYADALQPGDKLFTNFGDTHVIARRKVTKGGTIKTIRGDGWVDYFNPDDVVTIMPGGAGRGRKIDRESSGSVQGYIETGRYSTFDEERAMNPGSHDPNEVA